MIIPEYEPRPYTLKWMNEAMRSKQIILYDMPIKYKISIEDELMYNEIIISDERFYTMTDSWKVTIPHGFIREVIDLNMFPLMFKVMSHERVQPIVDFIRSKNIKSSYTLIEAQSGIIIYFLEVSISYNDILILISDMNLHVNCCLYLMSWIFPDYKELMVYGMNDKQQKPFPESGIKYLSVKYKRHLITYGTEWQHQQLLDQDIDKDLLNVNFRDSRDITSPINPWKNTINQPLIPDLIPGKDYIICSGTGTGKTQAVKKLTSSFKTLYVTYRRSQTLDLARKNKMTCYLDEEKNDYMNYIISIQSLYKLDQELIDYDYVIVDECQSVIKELLNLNTQKRHIGDNIASFNSLIRNAKNIIFMDAEIDQMTVNMLKEMRPTHQQEVIFNSYKRIRRCGIIEDKQLFIGNILNDLKSGVKVGIACATKKFAKSLYVNIQQDNELKSLKGLLWTSDGYEGIQDIDLSNLNQEIVKLDYIIFTSVMESAVSIESKHIQNLYCYCHSEGTSSSGLMQMMGRIRDIENTFLYGEGIHEDVYKVPLKYEDVGVCRDSFVNENVTIRSDYLNVAMLSPNAPQWLVRRSQHEHVKRNLDIYDKFHMLCYKLKSDGFIMYKMEEKKIKIEFIEIPDVSVKSIPDITHDQSVKIKGDMISGKVISSSNKLCLKKYRFTQDVQLKEIMIDESLTESQSEEIFNKAQDKLFDLHSRGHLKNISLHKELMNDNVKFKGRLSDIKDNDNKYTISGIPSEVIIFNKLISSLGLKNICDTETVIPRDKILENKSLIDKCIIMCQFKQAKTDEDYIRYLGHCIRKHIKIFSVERTDHHGKKFKLKFTDKYLSYVDIWDTIK